MARVTVDKNYFQFTQGKITEASPLSFPENSMKDELNIDINFDGTIQRRKGIDYEPGYTLFGTSFEKVSSSTNPGGPLAQIYKWENVGGYPKETPILVVRYGTHLVFYESLEEPLSSAVVGSMMEVGASESIISDSFLGFAEAKGYLFVVGQGFDPLYIKYNPTTNNFEKTSVTIKIRDLDGLPEDIEDHIRPSTLTGIHRYNLLNQGWPFRRVISKNVVGGTRPVNYEDSPLAFLRDPVRGHPSNSDLYRSYTESGDEKGDMVEAWIRSVPISTSRAPRGKVIIEAFRENRKELAQEYSAKTTPVTPWVPPNYEERSTTSRPTCVTFFQGHVMFSGVNDLDYNDKIYVSQSLVDVSRAGRAYSVNDPTSGIESSPLDTDGGVIRIEGVDRILSLQAIGGHLLVIGNNGLWSIRGTEGGFSVNDIVLNKLSSVGGISASSVVNYEGTVLFWSDSGIYAVSLDSQFDTLSVANITEETIQRDYVAIPEGKKKYANPIVDTLNRKVYWLYNNDATDPINCRMNRVLVLDMRTSSFFDYEFPVDENNEYPFVVAGFSKPRVGIFESTELVTVDGVTVTVNSEDVTVTSSVNISTGIGNAIKYLTFKGEDNNWRVLFSELYNTKFVDWASDVEGGVDYISFVETGYELMDDSMRDMQATYIFTYFNRTEQGFIEVDEPGPGPEPTPETPTDIGQFFGGGLYIGDIVISDEGENSGMYAVIMAGLDGEAQLPWRTLRLDTPGTDSVVDGMRNTLSMQNVDPLTHLAGMHCLGYEKDGHADWYMPSEDELGLAWENRNLLSGLSMEPYWYWSSTQDPTNEEAARMRIFTYGTKNNTWKDSDLPILVRPVRRIKKGGGDSIIIPEDGLTIDMSRVPPGKIVGFCLKSNAIVTGWPDGVSSEIASQAEGSARVTFNGSFPSGAPSAAVYAGYTTFNNQEGYKDFLASYTPLMSLFNPGGGTSFPLQSGGATVWYTYNPQSGEMVAYVGGAEVGRESTLLAGDLTILRTRNFQNSGEMLALSGDITGIPVEVMSIWDTF